MLTKKLLDFVGSHVYTRNYRQTMTARKISSLSQGLVILMVIKYREVNTEIVYTTTTMNSKGLHRIVQTHTHTHNSNNPRERSYQLERSQVWERLRKERKK